MCCEESTRRLLKKEMETNNKWQNIEKASNSKSRFKHQRTVVKNDDEGTGMKACCRQTWDSRS